MVVLNISVDGKPANLYMDSRLHQGVELKLKPQIQKKDNDGVWIIDGGEGSGKSVFGMQFAKVLDPSFDLDRVCMTPDEFQKAILRAHKGQAVLYDEAFTGLSSRGSLTEINNMLVSLMMEMRQKNLYIIIILPTFFLLDRYAALFRSKGLFHVYQKSGKRGYWIYFNKRKKNLLYLKGRKLFDYSWPKSSLRGRFMNQYVLDESLYRKKKKDALNKKQRVTKAGVFKWQRDVLIQILYNEFKISQQKIADYCNKYKFEIKRNTIAEILIERGKQNANEEEIEKNDETIIS